MLLSLFYSIAFFLQAVFTPGANRIDGEHVKTIPAKIKRIAFLDSAVCESSALVKPDSVYDIYYTLNDSGSGPEVFAINEKGELLDSKTIPDSRNKDWESLVFYKDSNGHPHLVIGDMGNNRNTRTDLCLYDYNVTANTTSTHRFAYANQHSFKFPKNKAGMNFDCEAFFKHDSSYYLISKNRGEGPVTIYQLANDTSEHHAIISQQLFFKGMVTDCSLYYNASTHKEMLAVLLYGRIFLFEILKTDSGFQLSPYGVIKFPGCGQAEGICWFNANELRITNERGKLFKIALKNNPLY